MTIALAIFGIAFAAFCVWLTVRIVNRREKWAKWTAVAVVGLPLLYVASFGPACWLASRTGNDEPGLPLVYIPLGTMLLHAPSPVRDPFQWYACLGMPADSFILIPIEIGPNSIVFITPE